MGVQFQVALVVQNVHSLGSIPCQEASYAMVTSSHKYLPLRATQGHFCKSKNTKILKIMFKNNHHDNEPFQNGLFEHNSQWRKNCMVKPCINPN